MVRFFISHARLRRSLATLFHIEVKLLVVGSWNANKWMRSYWWEIWWRSGSLTASPQIRLFCHCINVLWLPIWTRAEHVVTMLLGLNYPCGLIQCKFPLFFAWYVVVELASWFRRLAFRPREQIWCRWCWGPNLSNQQSPVVQPSIWESTWIVSYCTVWMYSHSSLCPISGSWASYEFDLMSRRLSSRTNLCRKLY